MKAFLENAAKMPCEFIVNPTDEKYLDEHTRQWQGIPTIAVTKGGRIFLGWYSGGALEPDIDNFNLLAKSDDGGETWSAPLAVIQSDAAHLIHAFDIQLFTAPDGRLFVYWTQNDCHPDETDENGQSLYGGIIRNGIAFSERNHSLWYVICENPDADELVFTKPARADMGVLRCKPLVLPDGRWLCCNYDRKDPRYGYSFTRDGITYERHYGAKKIPTPFDESMAYRRANGDIVLLARTEFSGELAETVSHDGGFTWDEARNSGIQSKNTRFYVGRTPSGRLLLVHNDHPTDRTNLTLKLSEDDGETWICSHAIDTRPDLSYPDVDFLGDDILLVYDRGRYGAKEVLFARFTEDDLLAGRPITPQIFSKV